MIFIPSSVLKKSRIFFNVSMNVAWDHKSNIRILQQKVLRINFTCYKDESNEILQSIDAIEADETDSDSDNDNGNDVVLL